MSSSTENQQRRALSIKEAAATCGVSRATLYRLIADGRLTTVKILGRRLVPAVAIDALLSGGSK
jgi:excisionase family DNA binding protein